MLAVGPNVNSLVVYSQLWKRVRILCVWNYPYILSLGLVAVSSLVLAVGPNDNSLDTSGR